MSNSAIRGKGPSTGARESQRIRDEFYRRLALVCDGSIYDEKRLMQVLGVKDAGVSRFVYMCEIHPEVLVTRRWTAGQHGFWQYVFQHNSQDHVRQAALEYADTIRAHAESILSASENITRLHGIQPVAITEEDGSLAQVTI